MSHTPKIFVFCNGCQAEDWHVAQALAEDGHFLAAHICSDHGWIPHDMGITSDWKHDSYQVHYPEGYELVLVAKTEVKTHEGIKAAYTKHLALAAEARRRANEH